MESGYLYERPIATGIGASRSRGVVRFRAFPEQRSRGVVRFRARHKAQLAIYDDFLETLQAWHITPPRFAALVIIARNPDLKLTDLAKSLAVARSGAVALVDALVALDYVVRHDAPEDKRAFSLAVTSKGRRALEAMSERVVAHDRRMTKNLSEAERAKLLALTKRVGR